MANELTFHVAELRTLSSFLLTLADEASERLSLTQAAFFMAAATADAVGKPASRITIIEDNSDAFRGSIRNSYRQLMQPSRLYPNGLGWLTAELNPLDSREKFLRLTDKGRTVVERALAA